MFTILNGLPFAISDWTVSRRHTFVATVERNESISNGIWSGHFDWNRWRRHRVLEISNAILYLKIAAIIFGRYSEYGELRGARPRYHPQSIRHGDVHPTKFSFMKISRCYTAISIAHLAIFIDQLHRKKLIIQLLSHPQNASRNFIHKSPWTTAPHWIHFGQILRRMFLQRASPADWMAIIQRHRIWWIHLTFAKINGIWHWFAIIHWDRCDSSVPPPARCSAEDRNQRTKRRLTFLIPVHSFLINEQC